MHPATIPSILDAELRSNALIQELHEDSYSPELLNALINLAIKDAIAREESSCGKCFP
jgi:hypothetical protein